MNELVPSEIIERLERRHEELIGELDVLNARLEKTLNSFSRPAPQAERAAAPPGPTGASTAPAKRPTGPAQQDQDSTPGQEISPA